MRNITPQRPPAPLETAGPPPLSISLKDALDAPLSPGFGPDGFDLKPGPWRPPATVTAQMAREAWVRVAWMDMVQLVPAESASIRGWLLALGNSVASSAALTATDVQMKVSALLTLLDDYPAGVFSKGTLKCAARRFTFFPSFAELSKVLDEEAAELRRMRDRLQAIADARPKARPAPANDWTPPDEEAKARVRSLMQAAGFSLPGDGRPV